jgi:hypothetical protein
MLVIKLYREQIILDIKSLIERIANDFTDFKTRFPK